MLHDSLIEMGIKEGVTHITDNIVSDDTISHVDLIAVHKKNGLYVDNRKLHMVYIEAMIRLISLKEVRDEKRRMLS